MTTNYNTLLKTTRWYEKRKTILSRDNNKCRSCGVTSGLHIHHRQYHINIKTGLFLRPWEYADRYLITLCSQCHEAGHKKFKIPTFNI